MNEKEGRGGSLDSASLSVWVQKRCSLKLSDALSDQCLNGYTRLQKADKEEHHRQCRNYQHTSLNGTKRALMM